MAEHPIQGLMNVTMEKIHQMVDSNTIIGKPIITEDGTTILPVSKVSFGFASGGTDFDGKNAANKDLFGGGSGAGVNIQPCPDHAAGAGGQGCRPHQEGRKEGRACCSCGAVSGGLGTGHSVPPALARPPAWCSPRTSRQAFLSILVAACTSDMASRILPEYPVPIPAGRQGVSPANVLGVGPRRASVGAGLESRAVRGESSLLAC